MTSTITTAGPASVAALDALFQQRREQVPVLAQRADAESITTIRSPEDLVPLLFPHTTYKSYPESLIAKGRWSTMNRWLDSLSTYRVGDVDVSGVEDIEDWINRLAAAGHEVSSSSGTSGKSSFLNKTRRDNEVSRQNMIDCLVSQGMAPESSWHVVPVGPETGLRQHTALQEMIQANYGRADNFTTLDGPASTGHYRYMAGLQAMRRAMTDGTAAPDEVAKFEAQAAVRQQAQEDRLRHFAEQILRSPHERMFFSSQYASLFRLTEILRELGAADGDLTGANALTVGGGLKGNTLPEDYQEQIARLLNIAPGNVLRYYSMQELNVRLPNCLEGRYHVPETIALFVLDKDGESLAEVSDGQVEGRAGFFDTTVDGRWGGTISGDKIRVDLRLCPCGRPGSTVFPDITRYSDIPGDDKITCAGTMDAYVRGHLED